MSQAPPTIGPSPGASLRQTIASELEAARRRSLDLLDAVPEAELVRQISPIMSPLVWDLAHVANYEDIWLVRGAGSRPGVGPDLDHLYDAFRHPRANRPALALLGPDQARDYMGRVRQQALETLSQSDLDPEARPLVRDGFVFKMVIQHEHQHDETMLATLQLRAAPTGLPRRGGAVDLLPGAAAPLPSEVWVDAGEFVMGTDDETWAYDNERPAHVVDLAGFWIDTVPVTNRRFAEFIDDGGYRRRDLWTAEGWAWRQTEGAEHPAFWSPEPGGGWYRRRFGDEVAVDDDEAVQHVSWFEADAYARWSHKRLPTEAEWEKAASWTPGGTKRRYPWGDEDPVAGDGRANLDQVRLGPCAVGSHPAGASAYGCHQMVGDVWEWTSSEFDTYPGFVAFPYPEYSQVFAASGYKVLRGGSWASSARAVRTTFRNWDHPVRRQIFSGFRCARDAD